MEPTTAEPDVDEPTPIVDGRLDNGLRVVVSQDRLAPVVAVDVWYGVGSRHEREGRTGLAHLFEHLMFQGSRNVGPAEHFAIVQSVGGTLNGTTSFDRTNYFETVPTHAWELALWLEADRMGTLVDALTQDNLDNQRDVVKNERRQRYDNQPYGTVWERLFAHLYPPGHPYHHMPIGSMADLDATSLDDCHDFFRRHYAPANATIAIVGDIAPDQAFDGVRRHFAAIPTLAEAAEAPDGAIGPRDGEHLEVVDEDVPAQARYLAYRLPPAATPGNDAANVACEVLTGGSASRLVRRLVRQEQQAQSVRAGVQGLSGGTDVGVVIAHARTGGSLDRIAEVIDDELARLAADGPTDEELQRAVARLTRDWLEHVATVMGRADELCSHATLHGDPRGIDTVLARIRRVTARDVRDVVATHLLGANRAVVEYRGTAAAT
jgi:predicted Zn-dependent peptidase